MKKWVLAAVVVVGIVGLLMLRPRPATVAIRPARSLPIPSAATPIVLDGKNSDEGWRNAARTGVFACQGVAVCPHSEARMVWHEDRLYVFLYAADRDILSPPVAPDGPVWLADHFRLSFSAPDGDRILDLSPRGTITDAKHTGAYDFAWQSGAVVKTDIDGTLDVGDDEDEEWALELSLPLASLGLQPQKGQRIQLSIRRCDVPAHGPRICSIFGDRTAPVELVLD